MPTPEDKRLREIAEAVTCWRDVRGDTRVRGCKGVGLQLAFLNCELGSQADIEARANAEFIATFSPPTVLSLLDRALAAEGERDEALSAQGLYARTLFSLKDTLLNVTDDIEDEGDRAYFGSSNDADALRAVTQRIDALHWDEVLAHTQPKVDLYTAIENRMAETRAAESRALAAEARVLGLVEALKAYQAVHKSVTADLHTAHQNQGNGASQWMREDDAELRRDFRKAGELASRALLSLAHGGVEVKD